MEIIPLWAYTLAAIAFAVVQIVFNLVLPHVGFPPPAWARVLMGFLGGAMLACYFLLLGYVNRDSRRRGMNPVLWTVIAILIPNGLGIILYFVLRQPRQKACPQCGNAIQTGFNFCPRCNYKLSPSCPHCQRLVGEADVYCPYCGTSLLAQPAPL